MKRIFSALAIFLILLSTWVALNPAQPARAARPPAPVRSAYELIDAVNALRASNGMGPLNPNGALMAAAQGHADYQASISDVTHYGPGGSRPADRARAAGYGDGKTFFLSENIYGGLNATAQIAVNWWTGDAPHWNTMMGANYTEIGAGMATDSNNVNYFIIDVGYVSGAPANNTPRPTVLPGTPQPTVPPINPVVTSTPNPDGSVVHTVQWGQTLITIAKEYGLTVNELKTLNGLGTDAIYVGQPLIVKAGATPTLTPTTTATPTLTATATATRRPRTPTRTKAPTATQTQTPRPTSVLSLSSVKIDRQTAGIAMIVVCALGLVIVGVTSIRGRRGG